MRKNIKALSFIYNRKSGIDKIIKDTKDYSNLPSYDIDTLCYLLSNCTIFVYASIEFMIETIISTRVDRGIKYHTKSNNYYMKNVVKHHLGRSEIIIKENFIDTFNNPTWHNTEKTIKLIIGDTYRDILCNEIDIPVLSQKIDSIKSMRHGFAHGSLLPHEMGINIDDLKNDFEYIYEKLILKLIKTLP